MSFTRVLFPLALISLLITIASANYEYNRNYVQKSDVKEPGHYKKDDHHDDHDHDDQSHKGLVDHDFFSRLNYDHVIIQGVILCNSGSSYTPLEGAIARITCTSSYGSEDSYSVLSPETDQNGYFYAPLSNSDLTDIKLCKVYLEQSPSDTCNVPSHSGVFGAPLSLCLGTETDKLYYTMGTLFYSSQPSTTYNSATKKDLDSDENNNNGY